MKRNGKITITDEMLIRYLQGEATPDMLSEIEHWAQHPENKNYLQQLNQIWALATPAIDTAWINVGYEWNQWQQTIRHQPAAVKIGFLRRQNLSKIAAVWMLLAGLALFLVVYQPFRRGNTFTANTNVLIQKLPDGSVVTLNKKAAIACNKFYNKKNRIIELSGEAFFAVAPDKKLPFMVHAGNVIVEVLGTSFNIKSTADATQVIVEAGSVKVKAGQQELTLTAGERMAINNKNGSVLKQKTSDSLYTYYRTRHFICRETPLKELLEALNDTYNLHVLLQHGVEEDLPITANFDNVPASDIIRVICATLHLVAVKQNNNIILEKNKN